MGRKRRIREIARRRIGAKLVAGAGGVNQTVTPIVERAHMCRADAAQHHRELHRRRRKQSGQDRRMAKRRDEESTGRVTEQFVGHEPSDGGLAAGFQLREFRRISLKRLIPVQRVPEEQHHLVQVARQARRHEHEDRFSKTEADELRRQAIVIRSHEHVRVLKFDPIARKQDRVSVRVHSEASGSTRHVSIVGPWKVQALPRTTLKGQFGKHDRSKRKVHPCRES